MAATKTSFLLPEKDEILIGLRFLFMNHIVVAFLFFFFLSIIVFLPKHQVIIIFVSLIIVSFLLLPLIFLLLLTLFLNIIEAYHNFHFVFYLSFFPRFLLSYLFKRFIHHVKDISYLLLVLVKVGHQIFYLFFELLIVVKLRHTTSFELLLNLFKALLNMFMPLSFLSLAFLLLFFIYSNKSLNCLSCKLVPSLSPWMLFNEQSNNVIFWEIILLKLFLSFIFVHLLVLCF